MRNLIYKSITVLLLITGLFYSCVDKDYDLSDISGDILLKDMALVAPVGHTKTTLGKILDQVDKADFGLEVDVDGTYYITYEDKFELSSNYEVKVSGLQDNPKTFTGSGTNMDLLVAYNLDLEDISSSTLDSVQVINTELTIKVSLQSAMPANTTLTVELPDGLEPLNQSDLVINLDGVGSNVQKTIKIKDNSILKITQLGTVHSVDIKYTLNSSASVTGSDVNVALGGSIETAIIWGNISADDLGFDTVNKQLSFDMFRDFLVQGSRLNFSDPIIECEVRNYVGASADFAIAHLTAFNTEDGTSVSAQFPAESGNTQTTISMTAAPAPYSYSNNFITFDKTNGAINELLNISPDSIDFSFTTTPTATGSGNQFIVTNLENYIEIILKMKLPMAFEKDTYLLTKDTLELDLADMDELDDLKEAVVRIIYTNGFPITCIATATFLDENDLPITSLTQTMELKSADVDTDGFAIKSTKGEMKIELKDNWKDAKKTKNILLETRTTGKEAGKSKIYFRDTDEIELDVDIYGIGDLSFEF